MRHFNTCVGDIFLFLEINIGFPVSTGIPGYGLRTEMIRNFFSISIKDKVPEVRNSGSIPERLFLSVNRKFPEHCSVIPERSGKFRFTEKLFRNFPGKGSGKTRNNLSLCKR